MITFENLMKQVSKQELLTEGISFYQYKALVRITYNPSKNFKAGSEKIAEIIRSVPGGTRVSTASMDKGNHRIVYNVRVISQKDARHCFIALKKNLLQRFGKFILKVEVAPGSIEQKNFVK